MVDDPAQFEDRIGIWDTSQVTDFSHVFSARRNRKMKNFNEDISRWDLSNATTTEEMFYGCNDFNCDLSGWATLSVTRMDYRYVLLVEIVP